VGEEPGPADQRGPAVSHLGTRTGKERLGPSDLVKIDGPPSSPSSSHAGQRANPSAARPGAGAHLGAFPVTRR
jgi:hypothetical protein